MQQQFLCNAYTSVHAKIWENKNADACLWVKLHRHKSMSDTFGQDPPRVALQISTNPMHFSTISATALPLVTSFSTQALWKINFN